MKEFYLKMLLFYFVIKINILCFYNSAPTNCFNGDYYKTNILFQFNLLAKTYNLNRSENFKQYISTRLPACRSFLIEW